MVNSIKVLLKIIIINNLIICNRLHNNNNYLIKIQIINNIIHSNRHHFKCRSIMKKSLKKKICNLKMLTNIDNKMI